MSEGQNPTPPPPAQQPPSDYSRRRCCCERCSRRSLIGPVLLVTIGILFMVDELTWRFDFWDLWPVILIVVGIMKLLEFSASTEGHR